MDNNAPFLDKLSEIKIRKGKNLPHWDQDGKIQYVTFRLGDTLPQRKIKELELMISQFESLHPKPWSLATKKEFRRIVSDSIEKLMHKGYGSCILKDSRVRNVLSEAIFYKDDIDYFIYAFVIMPNHVHMLIQPFPGLELKDILYSIKKFSAYRINRLLNRYGKLWHNEAYDHIVRDYDEFKHCYNYIINNPDGLPDSDYTLYYY